MRPNSLIIATMLAAIILIAPAMAASISEQLQTAQDQITDIWYEGSATIVGLSLVMSIIIIVRGHGTTSYKRIKARSREAGRATSAVGKARKSVRSDIGSSVSTVRRSIHAGRSDGRWRSSGRRRL